MTKNAPRSHALDRILLATYPVQLGAVIIGIVCGIALALMGVGVWLGMIHLNSSDFNITPTWLVGGGLAMAFGATGGIFVVRETRAEAQARIDASTGAAHELEDFELAHEANVTAHIDAPAPTKRFWLAVPLVLVFGGVKFCGKRGAKLADNALNGSTHLVDDAIAGARQGLREADNAADKGSLIQQATETAIEEGIAEGVESLVDPEESDQ